MEIINLFKLINNNQKAITSVNVCAIVNGKVQSSISWASGIEKSLFINFEGKYDMGDNALEFYAFEGREGFLIKFDNGATLFIPNDAKIKTFEDKGCHVFDIKDHYSSMHIQLQVVTNNKVKL